MCSPDEICKNDICEDVPYAETVSLEKGNHSYFESLITSHVFVPNSAYDVLRSAHSNWILLGCL